MQPIAEEPANDADGSDDDDSDDSSDLGDSDDITPDMHDMPMAKKSADKLGGLAAGIAAKAADAPATAKDKSTPAAPPESSAEGEGIGVVVAVAASSGEVVAGSSGDRAREAAPREKRAFDWHGFKLSPVFQEVEPGRKIHTAWGAICGRHRNSNDTSRATCKKFLSLGTGRNQLSSEHCLRLVKQWVLAGFEIPVDDTSGRQLHLARNPRAFAPLEDLEIEAQIRARLA